MILKYEGHKLGKVTVFERVEFRPPFKPTVTYEQEACFLYSIQGTGKLYGGLKQEQLTANESILMKCGSFLNHWRAENPNRSSTIIAIHVTPEILEITFENKIPDFLKSSNKVQNKIFTKIPKKTIIDEYIKGLIFYFDNPALMNNDLIILKLRELILLLYRTDYLDIRDSLATMFDPVILNFKSIIKAQLFEELEIKDYAALTNMSLSSFKRRFKQVFNDTPGHYIQNKRLDKASELLKLTDKRIAEVSFECGFKSQSSFSKLFSKKFGLSPSEYKNSV